MTTYEIADKKTPVPEDEYILTAAKSWKRFYGQSPKVAQLACCLSQMVLETGRKPDLANKLKFLWGVYSHNYNVGNIKSRANDGSNWQFYDCGEEVSLKEARRLIAEDPGKVSLKKAYKGADGSDRASIWILAPHPWTRFRAYESLSDGILDYIDFLVSERDRYLVAWNQGVMRGNPVTFSLELGKAGYYTADPKRYTKTVVALFQEFEAKIKAVLEAPEGLALYVDDERDDRDRILALTGHTVQQALLGEYDDVEALSEDEALASQAPNLPTQASEAGYLT